MASITNLSVLSLPFKKYTFNEENIVDQILSITTLGSNSLPSKRYNFNVTSTEIPIPDPNYTFNHNAIYIPVNKSSNQFYTVNPYIFNHTALDLDAVLNDYQYVYDNVFIHSAINVSVNLNNHSVSITSAYNFNHSISNVVITLNNHIISITPAYIFNHSISSVSINENSHIFVTIDPYIFNHSSLNVNINLGSSVYDVIVPPEPISYNSYRNYTNLPNNYITKCPTTKYNNERELYDLLVTEAYNKHGVCVDYYVTSFDVNSDRVFAEDNNREFTRKFKLMARYELPRENKMWSKFGIEGLDQFSMFVSKRHFWTASTYNSDQTAIEYPSYIPRQGDVIMAAYNNYLYEIVNTFQLHL